MDKTICKLCNGNMTIKKHFTTGFNYCGGDTISLLTVYCPQCNGKGYITWIDEILDRNRVKIYE